MRNRLILGVLVGIVPALALADGHFGELDANVDGKISPDEMEADVVLQPHFSEMDANHDGGISTGEFSKFEESSNQDFIDGDRGIRTDSERGKNNNRAGNAVDLRAS